MNDQLQSGMEMKLFALYEQAPSAGFVQALGEKLQAHQDLKTPAWRAWIRDLRQSPRARLVWSTAALLVLAAVFFATPQGRSLAQAVTRSFLGYFNTTSENKLPLPATPPPVPTYSYHPLLVPFEPQTTPAADPTQCGPTVSELTSTPYCLMLNVQAEAGFDLKVIGINTLPLTVEGVWLYQGSVGISYNSLDGAQTYRLSQGLGDFPADYSTWGLAQTDAVKQVVVGNHPGELVVGRFVNYEGKPTIDWSTWLPPVQLRWREGNHWYSLSGDRYLWTGDKVQADQLVEKVIAFANHLVSLSADHEKMAGNVEQSPQDRAGFTIMTPAELPEGFTLDSVQFGIKIHDLPGVVIVTYSFSYNGQWAGAIGIYETPVTNQAVNFVNYFTGANIVPKFVLSVDEKVQVGQSEGRYMVKSGKPSETHFGGDSALVWEEHGLKFMLQPYFASYLFGGRFTRETLIAIAESIK